MLNNQAIINKLALKDLHLTGPAKSVHGAKSARFNLKLRGFCMFIYIIKSLADDGPIKIGKSNDPQKRLSTLQCAHPKKLELIKKYHFKSSSYTNKIEKKLHRMLKKYHVGGEWFSGDALKEAMFLCQGHKDFYDKKVMQRTWF